MPAFKKPPKTINGRPPKLNQELIDKITAVLRMGSYIETAVAHCGVHKSVYYQWVRKGAEQKHGIHRKLLDSVEKALADGELRDLKVVDNATNADWKAAAWKLERRSPKKWGRQEKLEMSGPDGGPQVIVTIPDNGFSAKEDESSE